MRIVINDYPPYNIQPLNFLSESGDFLFEKELKQQIIHEIKKSTEKIQSIINKGDLDIKQMADLHRYAETRKFMVETLSIMDGL